MVDVGERSPEGKAAAAAAAAAAYGSLSGCCETATCSYRTELSHYIMPWCIQQDSDPCNPLVYYHSPDLPPPDGH
ncbi:hypothetical protein NQZ68_008088 [Dissostichus eleginoides]|nr:hypothetical protein NQZ68_008088 [Dissostichus eleginoides]